MKTLKQIEKDLDLHQGWIAETFLEWDSKEDNQFQLQGLKIHDTKKNIRRIARKIKVYFLESGLTWEKYEKSFDSSIENCNSWWDIFQEIMIY